MEELDDELYQQIQTLSEEGDQHAEEGQYTLALEKYWDAFDLIPEPKTDWEAATWVLVAIGDTNYHNGDFQAGIDNLGSAMHCPGAIGNPFIHLRLGECYFEAGETKKAANELARAYALEGEEIFAEEDPKYFEFLKTQIKL